ncbi:MAG: hypothetical protein ACYTXY_49920, partial [Nostoc sp.]
MKKKILKLNLGFLTLFKILGNFLGIIFSKIQLLWAGSQFLNNIGNQQGNNRETALFCLQMSSNVSGDNCIIAI